LLIGTSFSFGAYFPSSWGWTSLALAWVVMLALLVRTELRVGRLEAVLLATVTAFTGWIALSLLWSDRVPQTVLEVERTLVYVAAIAAVVAVAGSRSASTLLGGVLAGTVIVGASALAARLFPEHIAQIEDDIGGFRLDEPIGYWNAVGLIVDVGVLLAIGVAASAPRLGARAAAGAAIVVLVPPLYFSFGRGPWLALALGLATLVAVDPRRLQRLAVVCAIAPFPAAAVWIASHSGPLTERGAAVDDVAREGQRYAVLIVLLAAAAAAFTGVFGVAERRVRVPRVARHAWIGTLGTAAVVVVAVMLVRYGGPVTLVERGYESFTSPPVGVKEGESGAKRLFTLSSNGRLDTWAVSWDAFRDRPLLGSGAGTWERVWLEKRPTPLTVRDAHSLYVEMLAEVGLIGLGLLVVTLAVPVAAATRARRHPLVPSALAGYVAFLAHAGVDWDWEIPAATLPALLCGTAVVLAARPSGPVWRVGTGARLAGVVAAGAVATVGLVGAIGNTALRESEKALLQDGDAVHALAEARRATSWAPWSSDAWQWRSRAEGAAGFDARSLASAQKALDLDPEDWELWLDLAYSLEGHRARVEAVRRAFALNPLSRELELAFKDEALGVTLKDVQSE
jgi:hypothetical protein